MGYPWGKAPLIDGTGTTPTDMQRIIGAQYTSSGVLPNGGLTVDGTSAMAYKVNAGACFMWTNYAARLGMLVPVDEVTVPTDPAPPTGSRTDTVYVDGRGVARVVAGTAILDGVAIARFTVPAGITATTAAQQSINRNFAIATGASMGRLAHWRDPGGGEVGPAEVTRYAKNFYLPSDRVMRADLVSTIRSATSAPGIAEFSISFEHESGPGSTRRMLSAHTSAWTTDSATWSFMASEGAWTVYVKTKNYSGGNFRLSDDSSMNTELHLWDAGVTR